MRVVAPRWALDPLGGIGPRRPTSPLDGGSRFVGCTHNGGAPSTAAAGTAEIEARLRNAACSVAVAADRERIARDLHDTVIQRLFATGLNLQLVSNSVDPATRSRVESTLDDLDETIRDIRTTIFALHGQRTAPHGLRGRVLQVVVDARPGLGFEPRVEFNGVLDQLEEQITENLLPILREALANVTRHAGATSARVTLACDDDDVTLTVSDNGAGIRSEVLGGNGLRNMRQRTEAMGGEFRVSAGGAGGCCVSCRIPFGNRSLRS